MDMLANTPLDLSFLATPERLIPLLWQCEKRLIHGWDGDREINNLDVRLSYQHILMASHAREQIPPRKG